MKLRTKILLISALPVIFLGMIAFVIAGRQLKNSITEQAYNGMEATALAISDIFAVADEGVYHLDENGQLWKGETLNISESAKIVDDIKEKTSYEVTVFYGDTRYLTTIVDETGERQVGTQASAEIVEKVLKQGEYYASNDIEVLGERYIAYYVPLLEEGSAQPVGMIFLGEHYTAIDAMIKAGLFSLMMPILLVLLLAVAIAVIVGVKTVSGIHKGIGHLTELGEGNLGVQIEPALLERRDVVGDMSRSVQNLAGKLSEIVEQIQDQCDVLHQTSESCNDMAANVMGSMEQIDASVQEIAATAASQAQDAETAENNINIMGDMVHETTVKVNDMAEAAKQIAQVSDSAKEALRALHASMESVVDAVEDIATQTNNTHESVQQISEVTNVISEIATQTNLLSLNASIEAARAGEQGKGFAVVASEIQKLAEQSNKSASEIQLILAQLRANSEQSVSAMEEVKNIIHSQGDKIEETSLVFTNLEAGIDESISSLAQIKEKAVVMDNARAETVDIVHGVAGIAQENAASTQETAASVETVTNMIGTMEQQAKDLRNVADALDSEIQIFKLK